MQLVKGFVLCLLIALASSCIKQYYPELDSQSLNKYVVSGRITNQPGWQEVTISRSSSVDNPELIPVSGCKVNIIDSDGGSFSLNETSEGAYRIWLEQGQVAIGKSYRLDMYTPDSMHIVSEFDKMMDGPIQDSVYYAIEEIPGDENLAKKYGVRFYIDLNAEGYDSRFYKWEIMETWEYKSAHPAEYYYDGRWHTISPPDYSRNICWATIPVKEIYTLSTSNLVRNEYKHLPLHLIDGYSSTRLGILYSMMVKQYALTESAYNYWDRLRANSSGQGGLYDKQPVLLKGNLHNVTFPEMEVLGFFYSASESGKRYFYKDIPGITLEFSNKCIESNLPIRGWTDLLIFGEPIYYYFNEQGVLRILSFECVDCRRMGGSLQKPEFWPQ